MNTTTDNPTDATAILDTMRKIRLLREEIARAEEDFRRGLLELGSSDRDPSCIIPTLYWGVPEIRVDDLCEAFGMTRKQISEVVSPMMNTGVSCSVCGKEIPATSRSHLNELRSVKKHRWSPPLCAPCSADQSRARSEEARRHIEEGNRRREELRSMPYGSYLQTDEWRERRDRHLRSARYRCQLCNGAGELHVHHRTYERRGEERWSDLIVLCADCHADFHDRSGVA